VTLKRRAFLQQASLALGALGVGGTAWLASYQQALAKPARRKLALLIGINQYSSRAIDVVLADEVGLKGCLVDVDLQRQLLIHRFGFQPVDILTLTNQDASRQGILEAIDQHLVQQAQGDDVVLLHFSGYGSQVRIDAADPESYAAWVPSDGRLPSEESPVLTDLLEVEVAARLRQVPTANITTVIDAGYQDVGYLRWGNLNVRSRPTVPTGTLSAAGRQAVANAAPWPGLLLRAGELGRLVLESQWDGFSAGVFTYALTQSLWETLPDPNPRALLRRATSRLQLSIGPDQLPALEGSVPVNVEAAYALPLQTPPADGVILPTISGDRPLTLWLGGMAPTVLRHLQPGSRFVTASQTTSPAIAADGDTLELRLDSRTGLRATARVMGMTTAPSVSGQPVYETLRLLPQDLNLVVALDSQLKRVERVDATSALASIPFVTSIAAGERAADCLFGRLPTGPVSTLTAVLPGSTDNGDMPKSGDAAVSSYGLFAPNRTLVPGTMLAKEEAVKTAVNRLTPQLQTLLALKLIRLTENRSASWVGATVMLETTQPQPQTLVTQHTDRSPKDGVAAALSRLTQRTPPAPELLTLRGENRLIYRLKNQSSYPLHVLLVRFDSRGDCAASIAPPTTVDVEAEAVADLAEVAIAPGKSQTLPREGSGWGVLSGATWVETHVVLSRQPLYECFNVLSRDGDITPPPGELQRVRQPLKLARALLQDLHQATVIANPKLESSDYYALGQDQWATFTFNYTIS
jgi:hypothetical protein